MSKSESETSNAAYEGARIREIRKSRGLSMKQLAASMEGNVHFTTIAKIETGKMRISMDWLRRISQALDVTPFEIVWDEMSKDNVRAVPLFAARPWPPASSASGEWIPLGHSPTMIGSDKSFSVAMNGPPDNFSDDPLYHVVIDPERPQLLNNHPYAFVSNGVVRLGIYRDSPSRFEQWLSDRPGVMLVGTEPFEMLGRIVWTSRDMFS